MQRSNATPQLNEWIPDIKPSIMDEVMEENFDNVGSPVIEEKSTQNISNLFSFHVVNTNIFFSFNS